jgi:hypothetical protein
MVDLDITTVSVLIASAGVLIAAAYYISQIRYQRKLRPADMVMRLYRTFASMDFQKAYQKVQNLEFESLEDYKNKYENDSEFEIAVMYVCLFFEGVGVLLHRKLIDLDLVDDLMSTDILYTWARCGELIKSWRESQDRPQVLEWFEYLSNELQNREKKLHKEPLDSSRQNK